MSFSRRNISKKIYFTCHSLLSEHDLPVDTARKNIGLGYLLLLIPYIHNAAILHSHHSIPLSQCYLMRKKLTFLLLQIFSTRKLTLFSTNATSHRFIFCAFFFFLFLFLVFFFGHNDRFKYFLFSPSTVMCNSRP